MDKELNKNIRKILFIDSFLGSVKSLSSILNEADREIEELFKRTNKYTEKFRNSNKDSEI